MGIAGAGARAAGTVTRTRARGGILGAMVLKAAAMVHHAVGGMRGPKTGMNVPGKKKLVKANSRMTRVTLTVDPQLQGIE